MRLPNKINDWELSPRSSWDKRNKHYTYVLKYKLDPLGPNAFVRANPGGGEMSKKWHTDIFPYNSSSIHKFHNTEREAFDYLKRFMESHHVGLLKRNEII